MSKTWWAAAWWVLKEIGERGTLLFQWISGPGKGHPMLRLAIFVALFVGIVPLGLLFTIKSHLPLGIANLYKWGFLSIILLVELVIILFLIAVDLRMGVTKETAQDPQVVRLAVKRLLGRHRRRLVLLSDGTDDAIQTALQKTCDFVEAAFGEGEGERFAQGSHRPQYRVMGSRDWPFRLQGALMDVDDLMSRADTIAIEAGFAPKNWDVTLTAEQVPDKADSPTKSTS